MVRVAPGAQWPASVAAQVSWQAKQTKFGCIQVYSSALHLLFLTDKRATVHSVAVTYIMWFDHFFRCAFVDSKIAEVDRVQIFKRIIFGSNALSSGLFVASLFFVTRQSHQAHQRNICLSWAIAILTHTLYCAETGRASSPSFWRYTTSPSLIW